MLDLPIIISSSGACINVLQKNGGYATDKDFHPHDFPDSTLWRINITKYLESLNTPFSFGHIENEADYQKNETEIFPADYRIQLIFTSYKNILLLSKSIKEKGNLYFTNDSNPKKNLFMGYITPKRGKVDAVNHVISSLQRPLAEILIIGDSPPDLEVGLKMRTPPGAKITCLIVGGSSLRNTIKINVKRKIIMGDIAFPQAIGPKSIVEFIKSNRYN